MADSTGDVVRWPESKYSVDECREHALDQAAEQAALERGVKPRCTQGATGGNR